MLLVLFKIGEHHYGLDTDCVAEIIPLVQLREIPGAPEYVAGLFDYRGTIVPVLDMGQLTIKKKAKQCLSTRIIIVNFQYSNEVSGLLGLIGESMTDTYEIDPEELQDTQIQNKKAPYLGKVFKRDSMLIQTVEIDKLISEDVRKKLFSSINGDRNEFAAK